MFQIDRDVDSVLRTKKPKETMVLPEVMVDKQRGAERKEEPTSQEDEPMVQGEESSKPEVIYLVSGTCTVYSVYSFTIGTFLSMFVEERGHLSLSPCQL